mmetsp:Transcript_32547/g.69768  ORF Transcript_32547/g.69768 Transcript_32547/m.69768 type:complete len:203 (-) Transcript_32547:172-780(-)
MCPRRTFGAAAFSFSFSGSAGALAGMSSGAGLAGPFVLVFDGLDGPLGPAGPGAGPPLGPTAGPGAGPGLGGPGTKGPGGPLGLGAAGPGGAEGPGAEGPAGAGPAPGPKDINCGPAAPTSAPFFELLLPPAPELPNRALIAWLICCFWAASASFFFCSCRSRRMRLERSWSVSNWSSGRFFLPTASSTLSSVVGFFSRAGP